MPTRSAGVLLWRNRDGIQVFLVHMGGPFWAKKDAAAWSIPKGEYTDDESPRTAAMREFAEEIGVPAPATDYVDLGEFAQSSAKLVTVFAAESDLEIDEVHSNTFEAEWPPRSGRIQHFPEIDRAEWMSLDDARIRIVQGQLPVLDALEQLVG